MKRLVSNKQILASIVYKTSNVLVQKIQSGTKCKKCFIIGNGYSVDIGENDEVIRHDPFMPQFHPKIEKEHTVYAVYFTFDCEGLEVAAYEIAKFVSGIQSQFEETILVGHSKCGLCFTNASCYCKRPVTLVTISTPFKGTIIADKKRAERRLRKKLYIKIYNKIFSNHNIDKDIVPYSDFLDNLALPICNKQINIVSRIRSIYDCRSFIDIFLYLLDNIMRINGDGVVPTESQYTYTNCITYYLFCSHASSLKEGLKII